MTRERNNRQQRIPETKFKESKEKTKHSITLIKIVTIEARIITNLINIMLDRWFSIFKVEVVSLPCLARPPALSSAVFA